MTIADLRKKYPWQSFYFFRDGYEMRKAPFYHDRIKGYEDKGDYVFVHM